MYRVSIYMLAIVLSRRDFREYDQIVSLYTKEEGKREALARGVKKMVSKNTAFLEPFSFVEADIVPGKEIGHVTTVQPIDIFSAIRSDLRKSLYASYLVKLLDKLIATEGRDERIFNMCVSWLTFVNNSKDINQNILPSFVLKLLAFLGFTPELDRCLNCNNPIAPSSEHIFDIKNGGILCSACVPRVSEQIPRAPLTEEARQAFKTLLNDEWEKVNNLALSKISAKQLHTALFQFALYHSERPLPDWEGVDTILDLGIR